MHYKKENVNITNTKKGLDSLVELTTNPEQVIKKENIRTLVFFIIFVVLFVYAVFFASKGDSWSVYAIFFFSSIWLSQTYSNFQSVIGIKFLSKYIDIKKVKNDLKNT